MSRKAPDFNPIPKPDNAIYSKALRQEIAEAFRQAKKLLLHGYPPTGISFRNLYICYSLEDSGHPAYETAKSIILERIYPDDSYDSWSICNNPQHKYTVKEQQTLRHQWLDALIEEFSA